MAVAAAGAEAGAAEVADLAAADRRAWAAEAVAALVEAAEASAAAVAAGQVSAAVEATVGLQEAADSTDQARDLAVLAASVVPGGSAALDAQAAWVELAELAVWAVSAVLDAPAVWAVSAVLDAPVVSVVPAARSGRAAATG